MLNFLQALRTGTNPLAGTAGAVHHLPRGADIVRLFVSLDGAGFSRLSRRGWASVDHASFGLVQWRWRNGIFFELRIKGVLVLTMHTSGFPNPDRHIEDVVWHVFPGEEFPATTHWRVESWLKGCSLDFFDADGKAAVCIEGDGSISWKSENFHDLIEVH